MATEKKTRAVNLSALPPERKRAAWEHLKKHQPATAELIESDDFQAAVKAFNGQVIVDIETESTCEE